MQGYKKTKTENSFDINSRFKELADRYVTFLESIGVRCVAYDDPNLPLFAKASKDIKHAALAFLENALAVFDELHAEGASPRNNQVLIWRTLNQLKLVPDSEIFNTMGDKDVVEIYGLPDNSHLAWNVRLMEQVSFTAEQLLCLPWWAMGERPQEVLVELQKVAMKLASGEISTSIKPNVPKHIVRELNSHELLIIELEIKCISPLRRDGKNAAYIVINSSEVVGSAKK